MCIPFKQRGVALGQRTKTQKNTKPHLNFKLEKSVSNEVKLISIIYRLLFNKEEK